MQTDSFFLKWGEADHLTNTVDKFKTYLSNEAMVDVTLACEGLTLKAHRIVLASCSTFFQSIFLENPANHPIVVLKDVQYTELKQIIDFIYGGEIHIPRDKIPSLIETAKSLNIQILGDALVHNIEIDNPVDLTPEHSVSEPNSTASMPPGPHPTETSMFPPEQTNIETENQAITNQSSLPISEQGITNVIAESEIKRSDSDIEDFNDMDSNVLPSTISTAPLENHGSNSILQSQLEQPVEQVAYANFAPTSFTDSALSLTEQTVTTDYDLQSSIQSNRELPNSFLATSTPSTSGTFAADRQQLRNSSATSTVPLQVHNTHSTHESQLEQPIEQGGDENFEPEPGPDEIFETKDSSLSTLLMKQSLTMHDAHSSQHQSTVTNIKELPHTSTDHSSLKPIKELPHTSTDHSPPKPTKELPHTSTSTDRSNSYCVTLSASDVLIVHSQQIQNSQGFCPKKIIPKKIDLIRPPERPNTRKFEERKKEELARKQEERKNEELKKKKVRFTDDVQTIVHSSDDAKQTEEDPTEVEMSDISDSRQVLVKIGTNGSITRTEKFFKCKKCPFKTLYPVSLKRHMSTKHENKPKQFKCDQCDYEAALKQHLVRHTAEVHEHVQRFQCSFCPYKCAQQCSLKRHIISVHEQKKPFKCDKCDFHSAHKESIKKHVIAIHEQKRDFTCDFCTYRCATKVNLNRHVWLMHEKKKAQKDDSSSDDQKDDSSLDDQKDDSSLDDQKDESSLDDQKYDSSSDDQKDHSSSDDQDFD